MNGVLRGRRGARLTALTSGGAIPDNADYDVVLEPAGQLVGTVNEDFAVESLAGDIFQLGNTSYRILRVEAGRVRVEDAHGQPPTIPFWLGEAPARSDELSQAVSRLRDDDRRELDDGADRAAIAAARRSGVAPRPPSSWSTTSPPRRPRSARCPRRTRSCSSASSTKSGGMQLVIHAPFGSRINRAWGLALRKRFCRKFNFELQAAATEDAIVLSLSTSHSFPLDEVARYLHSNTVREVLMQALLDAPMFTARWRWNANISLALPRFRGGRRSPAPLQRMRAEDLMAAVFPDQVACAENIVGDREIPDHPLVRQTIDDCLHEAMDIDGLERLLRGWRRRDRRRRARPARALAARARDPHRAAVRLSRRRAAGRAPHAGGDGAALARRRRRGRSRPARCRSHRAGARGGVARGRRTPTSCTTRCSGSASCIDGRDRARRQAGRRCCDG